MQDNNNSIQKPVYVYCKGQQNSVVCDMRDNILQQLYENNHV